VPRTAHGTTARTSEPFPFRKDKPTILTARRLHLEVLAAGFRRPLEVLEVTCHVALGNSHLGRELVGRERAPEERTS
jgi:hypothetical protein